MYWWKVIFKELYNLEMFLVLENSTSLLEELQAILFAAVKAHLEVPGVAGHRQLQLV